MSVNARTSFMTPLWEVFQKPAVSDVAQNGHFVAIYPTTNVGNNAKGEIRFNIPGNEQFTQWQNSYIVLNVELQGFKDGGNQNATTHGAHANTVKVAPINNIAHSLFSKISVTANNKEISSTSNYGYISNLNIRCNNDKESLNTFCRLEGWLTDDPSAMESTDSTAADVLKKRKAFFYGGRKGEFLMKPWIPLFQMDSVMLSYIEIDLIFTRHEKPAFYLMAADQCTAYPFNIQITDAVLYVHKLDAIPEYTRGIYEIMQEDDHPAACTYVDQQIIPFNMGSGIRNFRQNNLFQGSMPSRVLIMFVSAAAFDGAYNLNPFNFQHFDITSLTLFKNDTPYPVPPLKCNFARKQYTRAYYTTMASLQAPNPAAPSITFDKFASGSTIFSFDMSPDQCGGSDPNSITNRPAVMRLEVEFAAPLTIETMCLIYHETEMIMSVDKGRTVSVEKAL